MRKWGRRGRDSGDGRSIEVVGRRPRRRRVTASTIAAACILGWFSASVAAQSGAQSSQPAPAQTVPQAQQTAPGQSSAQSSQPAPAQSAPQAQQTAPAQSGAQPSQPAPTQSAPQAQQTAAQPIQQSADSCKSLDNELQKEGKAEPDFAKKKASSVFSGKSDEQVALQIGLERYAKMPSQLAAAFSRELTYGDDVAAVTFVGPQITADMDTTKICVKGYVKNGDPYQPVQILRVLRLTTETDPKLQVLFRFNEFSTFYETNEYLFVGTLTNAPATLFGYAQKFTLVNKSLSAVAAIVFVALVYIFLAWVTFDKEDAGDLRGGRWLVYTLSPVRITAGMFGDASLAQLQVLLFSFVVAFLLLQILLLSGVLSALSPDLLSLLGISAVAGATSKFTETLKTGLSDKVERYLIGKGWFNWDLQPLRDHATFANLLMTDGRFDVYKFQMAIFSVIVAAYVLIAGHSDLGNVSISSTVLSLIGISQGTYIAGKAVTERTADLEAAVAKMIDIETQLQNLASHPPADAAALTAQRQALVMQYRAAARTAANEFSPLQHRVLPKGPDGDIRADVLEPTGVAPPQT